MPPIRSTAPRCGVTLARLGIGLALFGVAAYFTASYTLQHYLHSEAFRGLLNEKTSAFLAADGHYEPITNSGFSFYSDGYSARGTGDSPLQAFKADQIRAEFEPGALFEGAWKIGALQIQRVKIDLAPPASPSNSAPVTAAAPATPAPVTAAAPADASGESQVSTLPTFAQPPQPAKFPAWVPTRFVLRQAKIEEAEITWAVPGREGRLSRTRLVLEPGGRDLLVTGYGGTLTQAGLPPLSVDHFKLRGHYPLFYLTDSLLTLGEGQSLDVSGQAGLGPARTVDFLIKYSGIGIAPYLPEDWRAGVKGRANGEARLIGTGGSLQAYGTLTLTGGQLEALPILEKIAAFTRTQQFRQVALQKAEADYHWEPGKLTVTRLEAESEGLIRINGGLTVENGEARGEFQLGVTPSSLQWLPGSRNRVFTDEHDGYAWTTLKVSGPLAHLNEDLTPRLTAAAGEELIDNVKGTLQNGAKSLFDLIKSHLP